MYNPNDVFPLPNVSPATKPWARKITDAVRGTGHEVIKLRQLIDGNNLALSGQVGVASRQIDVLTAQQQNLQNQQAQLEDVLNRLVDAGKIYEASSGSGSNGAVWYTNPPSVSASSRSGKFEISIFGTAAGNTSYYSFSTTGYPRDRIVGSSAAASLARVSGLGGASATSTVYGSWVVQLSANTSHTFTAQALGTSDFSSTVALKIQVRPLL